MIVYKDLKTSNFFIKPSFFMRDWLLHRFEDESGAFNDKIGIVRPRIYSQRRLTAKNRIIKEMNVKFEDCGYYIRTGEVSFALPDFGLTPNY